MAIPLLALALLASLLPGQALAADGPAPPSGGASDTEQGGAREQVGALIRRTLAAYGGERATVRLARVRASGKVTSPLHPGEVGRLTRVFSRPSRLRLEVAFPGSEPEVRVLDGGRVFRYGEPASGAVALALQLQAARLDLPALLAEWETRVVDAGEVTHEGQKLRVLGLDLTASSRIEAGIDPRSGRILYARCLGRAGPRPLELFTVYRDFRVVDGVLVPFHEEGWANGEPTGEIDLTEVEFPEDLPESAFAP